MEKTESPEKITIPENEKPETPKTTNPIDDVVSTMPAVDPEITNGQVMSDNDTVSQTTQSAQLTDSVGTVFNPEIHRVDETGNPSYTKLKRFRRKTKGKASTSPNAPNIPNSQNDDAIARRQSAVQFAAIYAGLNSAILSTDPPNDVEKAYLTESFDGYFLATKTIDLPPSMALLVGLGAYSYGKYAASEKSKKRVKTLREKMISWFAVKRDRFLRRDPEKKQKPEKPTKSENIPSMDENAFKNIEQN